MIRKAKINDMDKILDITARVVDKMNNIDMIPQWDTTYPNKEVFTSDIEKEELYVYIIDNEVVGFYAFNHDEDPIESLKPDYKILNNYKLIHRIAVDPDFQKHGVAIKLVEHAFELARNEKLSAIRIDTNSTNFLMNNFIKKMGFSYVGDMQLKPNKPIWYAYEIEIN